MFLLISDKCEKFTAAAPRLRNWLLAGIEIHGSVGLIDTVRLKPKIMIFKSDSDIKCYFAKLEAGETLGVRNLRYFSYIRYLKNFFDYGIVKAVFSILWLVNYRRYLSLSKKNIVVATSPSFHNILIGAFWKYIYDYDTVLADMRDEWARHPNLNKNWGHKVWEKFFLSKVDKVVTVSSFIKHRIDVNRILTFVVYNNSVDLTSFENRQPETSIQIGTIEPKIRYFGGLHPEHYNYNLLRDLITSNPDVIFEFFSNSVGKGHPMSCLLKEKNVRMNQMISRSASLKLQAQDDNINLFLCHKGKFNQGVVSTKLTEYIFSEKPILILDNCPHSDVATIIERFCTEEQTTSVTFDSDHVTLIKKRNGVSNPGYSDFRDFLLQD